MANPKESPHARDDLNKSTRRARNRLAQQQSRKRRQVAEDAQKQRVQLLEEVVEEMCTVLVGVVDKMLETEAIVKDHPPLAGVLRTSMAKILKLANKAADTGFHTESSIESPEDTKMSDDSVQDLAVPALDVSTSSTSSPGSLPEGADLQLYNDTSVTPIMDADVTYFQPPGDPGFQNIYPDKSLPLANPFGNGWFDFALSRLDDSLPKQLPPTLLEAFTLRLLRTTMFRGYFVLSGTGGFTSDEVHRIFGGAMRIRSRESLLSGLRWVLGPGKDQIYRASGVTWDLGAMVRSAGLDEDGTEFFSTADIQNQLLGLGATMVDSDTMEVPNAFDDEVDEEATPEIDQGQDISEYPSLFEVTEPLSFIDFNATRRPDMKDAPPRGLRISIPTLISILAQCAVCVSRGPVFPKRHLWAAMKFSIET